MTCRSIASSRRLKHFWLAGRSRPQLAVAAQEISFVEGLRAGGCPKASTSQGLRTFSRPLRTARLGVVHAGSQSTRTAGAAGR